jgi:hypothetical protein
MADELSQDIENALNKIMNTAAQSGNMRKELEKTIFETVSTLRNLFSKMKGMVDERTSRNKQLENEFNTLKTELDACRRATTAGHAETSSVRGREPPRTIGRQVLPSQDRNRKLYSSVVAGCTEKRYTLTVKSTDNQPPDTIKKLLKSKVNPTEIKVGITSLKSFRDGRVMIEASSKNEIETLAEKIGEKCGGLLDVTIQKLRKPRLVLLNIPEDITPENAEETLTIQNPELDLKEGDIRAKFCYTTKRKTRNLVIEVESDTRRKLMQARIELGWTICSADDYIVAKRCFRCSKYNHNFRDCKGEETCPLWTGSHKLKECTAAKSEHKCINCLIYNKHHQTNQIDTAHSSLDRNCPILLEMLEKYKQNTDC